MQRSKLLASLKQKLKTPLVNIASMAAPLALDRYRTPLLILMYHRILPVDDPRFANEEPGMIVTPETFRIHLQIVKQFLTPILLSEWVERRQQNKPLPSRACAITFDDGWRDNFEFALPILEKEQVPASIFAVSEMIGTSEQFWPNRLGRLLSDSAIDLNHPAYQWLRSLRTFPESSLIDQEITANIIHECKILADDEVESRLDAMEKISAPITAFQTPALMSWDQLRAAQRTGLIEIGSHTCRHRRLLPGLGEEKLHREVVHSKQRLHDELGTEIKLFCYPNGDASEAATRLVSRHYSAAVTTQRGINTPTTSVHGLLRIGVHEDISNTPDKFRARLSGLM